jgi:hypothetical protein
MNGGRKTAVWVIVLAGIAGITIAFLFSRLQEKRRPITVRGAVIQRDADPRKELPIADVIVAAANNLAPGEARSDSSGGFSLRLRSGLKAGQPITLQFRHPNYEPLDMVEPAGDVLYIAKLIPLHKQPVHDDKRGGIPVNNLMVRYAIKATTEANVGSAVRTFQVQNQGNVPCNGESPCSPDGKWKAEIASITMDAGEAHEFRNTRVSCIAGPCPFTRIEPGGIWRGRRIEVSARAWSDTATFLLEAEVFHPMISDVIRQSYPVVFGQALNFTLPSSAEGVSIEAEVGGTTIVFPLGPNLFLSWATCNARVNPDQTRVYRCEAKPGYRFP